MVDMNFQRELLKWYQDNKRELAFRKEKDAYKIWISEIMAQQTRIEAMLPYFERFMEACPNMESLAKCEEEKLNKLYIMQGNKPIETTELHAGDILIPQGLLPVLLITKD